MDVKTGESLEAGVREAYSRAALDPAGTHPFPVGRAFAESLGMPRDLLDRMPQISLDAYAGVSPVSVFAHLEPGSTVFDLGCGSGLDSLVAAERVGAAGRVIGIDFSRPMLDRARAGAGQAGIANVLFTQAAADKLPLASGSVDAVMANGIFNLNPRRAAIFSELGRVTRENGSMFAAELIIAEPLPEELKRGADNWFS